MKKYNCLTCGAELYWDSKAKCLKCEYCDSEYDVKDLENNNVNNVSKSNAKTEPQEVTDKNVVATDISEKNSSLVAYKCTHCGAEIVTANSTIATTCAYCGRAISISNKIVGNFKPDNIIPFSVSKEQATEIYKKYCKSSFLIPKLFLDAQKLKEIKGIYVPFWLHSFSNKAKATLSCENTSARRKGNDRIVTHHQYSVKMVADGFFDKIPTDALKNLDNRLMDNIEPFNYDEIKDFNPAYMAGYYAEEYNETDEETVQRAKERAQTAMQQEIIQQAGNYQQKAISEYNDTFGDIVSAYTMLPVWLFNVEYKNKRYTFAINGQTGKISGKLPMSIPKVCFSGGITFILAHIAILLLKIFC